MKFIKEKKQGSAWYVEKVIKGRIRDAPVLSEYITSIVSDIPNDLFFFNQKLLHEHSKKNSESAKESVPGSNYFKKILKFWDIHYKRGELFMEYQKASCLEVSEELCFHFEWNDCIGPKCNRISQPIPDPKNLCIIWMSFQPHLEIEKEAE